VRQTLRNSTANTSHMITRICTAECTISAAVGRIRSLMMELMCRFAVVIRIRVGYKVVKHKRLLIEVKVSLN